MPKLTDEQRQALRRIAEYDSTQQPEVCLDALARIDELESQVADLRALLAKNGRETSGVVCCDLCHRTLAPGEFFYGGALLLQPDGSGRQALECLHCCGVRRDDERPMHVEKPCRCGGQCVVCDGPHDCGDVVIEGA